MKQTAMLRLVLTYVNNEEGLNEYWILTRWNITPCSHDYLNRVLISFVAKRLESSLIASAITYSLANRIHLKQNYDCLHEINNCNIVGGASHLFQEVLWFSCLCICQRNKQSKRSRLHKFLLEQTKHFLVFFLLVAYVASRCFLAEQGMKHSICMDCKYIENAISTSVVVQFVVYLVKEQAVKAEKSSEVLTLSKNAVSGVFCSLRTCYWLLLSCWMKIWVKERNSEWCKQVVPWFTFWLCKNKQVVNCLDFTRYTQNDKPVSEPF